MTRLEEALQEGLLALENGQTIEEVLARYPKEAEALRPLLALARAARAEAPAEMPQSANDRQRRSLLARAADLRISRAAKRKRVIRPVLRYAMSLALVAILVVTSTRLVSASSGALPGDQLYSVKRSWEDLQLFLVFQAEDHQLLESRFTQERLDETHLLLTQGRSAPISFSGLVMHQQDGTWLVSGIRVAITASTVMPTRPIGASEPVMITGVTGPDGTVVAQNVQLLQPGVALPPLEPSGNEAQETDGGTAASSGQPTTVPPIVSTPLTSSQQQTYRFTGVVGAMQASAWVINGQAVYVDQAQIIGDVKVGSIVTFEGYYSSVGRFEVTQVDVNWTPQARGGGNSDSSKSTGTGGGESGSDDGGGE